MTCGCSTTYAEGDGYADVWREKVVITRKDHRCCECGATIPAGTKVCHATALYEGAWSSMYRCGECAQIAEAISMLTKECPLWGEMEDYAHDRDIPIGAWRERARGVQP